MPKRIQMTRQKPWRAENPDAVIVDRRSEFGNPYRVGQEFLNDKGLVVERIESAADAVTRFREHANLIGLGMLARRNLAGKDLACWCPLDQPCHADVLLELANRGAPESPSAAKRITVEDLNRAFGGSEFRPRFTAESEGDDFLFGRAPGRTPTNSETGANRG